MLSKILASAVCKADLCKVAYAETHFLQDKLNSAIALYLPSLNVLVGNGVLKMNITEKRCRVCIIYRRAGEDGLRNVFSCQKYLR